MLPSIPQPFRRHSKKHRKMAPQNEQSFLEESEGMEISEKQKEEMIRLIQQLLQGMGLEECSSLLEKESHITLEPETISQFRKGITKGNWEEVEQLATVIKTKNNNATTSVKCKLAKQRYLELLSKGERLSALHILRDKVVPTSTSDEEIAQLSSLVTCSNEDDLRCRCDYAGDEIERSRLAKSLQSDISSDTMIDQNRLWNLIFQSSQHQIEQCNDVDSISTLLRDCTDDLDCSRSSKENNVGFTDDQSDPDLSNFIITHRDDMIRIVLQLLRDCGFLKTFTQIEKETGVHCESPDATNFRNCIETAEWDNAVQLLPKLTDAESVPQASFLIGRQRYLENLECGKSSCALTVLQNHVSPYCVSPSELHSLATLLTCSNKYQLSNRSAYTSVVSSRKKLIQTLHTCIDCSILLEYNRLWKLVKQAQQRQREQCVSLNRPLDGFTLLRDYTAEESNLPQHTMAVLRQSNDEIWYLEFSPDGKWLSSGCRDGCVLLHNVTNITSSTGAITAKRLQSHKQSITHLSFCNDSQKLLSASTDTTIKCWKVLTGELLHTFSRHLEPVLSVRWLPCGDCFFSSSEDRSIFKWCVHTGDLQTHWVTPVVLDMAVTSCGKSLITIDSERQIICYNLEAAGDHDNMFHKKPLEDYSHGLLSLQSTGDCEPVRWILQERERQLVTCQLSDCGRYLLCGISIKESRGCSHLYDLHRKKRIQKYTGMEQLTHVIRPVFGGHTQGFVLSGSEDGRIVVIHRKTGKVLSSLAGHLKSANRFVFFFFFFFFFSP